MAHASSPMSFQGQPSRWPRIVIHMQRSWTPTTTRETDVANHLLGTGGAQQLLGTQSYGKMSLDVAVKSNLGWKRMALPSTSSSFSTFDTHKTYIGDASSLFSPSEVRFSDLDFVFVVAPRNAGFPLSPAFNAESRARRSESERRDKTGGYLWHRQLLEPLYQSCSRGGPSLRFARPVSLFGGCG